MKTLPLWLRYLIALPIALVAISLGVFVFMPNALAEDALTIDAPSQVRLPLAGPNLALLTLQVNNIQVRAEWVVEGSDSADFSVEGGTLVLVSQVTSATTKSAVVVVRDKFSVLSSSYVDLEAKATINIEFVYPQSDKIFVLGGRKGVSAADYLNDVWMSANGSSWQSLGNAGWAGRIQYAAVSHNGSMFIMGGQNSSSRFNDVWSSADGNTWNNLGNADWSLRYGLQAVSYNGKIYVSGGINGSTRYNDVWSSADGKNWAPETGAKFGTRYDHVMVEFGGKMLVMGGLSGGNLVNDEWSSSNGGTWNRERSSSSSTNRRWQSRRSFEVILHDGAMYLMGGRSGGSLNDVWSRTSFSWSEKTDNASWEARDGLEAASFNNRIYVFGGYNLASGTYFKDVWSSGDGTNWTKQTPAPSWPQRQHHQVLVHPTPDIPASR